MIIKYYVRTTLNRNLNSSYNQIPYKLLIDYNNNCGKAFIEQLEYIKNEDAVLLEDDIILCNNFKNRIESIIEKHPKDIINFFTFPDQWKEEGYENKFRYNQCTYFPKEKTQKLLSVIHRYNLKDFSAEHILSNSLTILKLKHYVYRPFLVQHLDNGSLMNHHPKFERRSPFFIDYLDELNLKYEDCINDINLQNKLIDLMHEKFKDIDNKKSQN